MSRLLLAVAVVVCGTASAQTAPSLEDIINRNTAARGGLEKIKAIQTEKATGRIIALNGMEAPFTMYSKRPNLTRIEMSLKGMQIVQVFDGTDSWMIRPGGEAQKTPGEQSRRARQMQTMDGLLLDYRASGMTAELAGKEDVEGSPAYKIKITSKSGDIIYQYVDAENFLDVKTTARVSEGGAEIEMLFGAYKPVGEVMRPHSIEQKMNGQSVMKMMFDKIEINTPIDHALFKFPVKADAKPERRK